MTSKFFGGVGGAGGVWSRCYARYGVLVISVPLVLVPTGRSHR